jgi:hypothetical protein
MKKSLGDVIKTIIAGSCSPILMGKAGILGDSFLMTNPAELLSLRPFGCGKIRVFHICFTKFTSDNLLIIYK